MKSLLKTIGSLALIIIFLFACFAILSIGYFAAWLHTYKVFTEKRAVAEIVVSGRLTDEKGSYAMVKYTPYDMPSALTTFLSPTQSNSNTTLSTQEFKVYGEVVHVGGPIVKFHDSLILLNFKTIFKVGELYGRYVTDHELEVNRTPDMASDFVIDGGYSEWKQLFEDMQANNLRGRIYNSVIDITQISDAGKYISNSEQTYILYITNTGFVLDEK